MSRAFTESVVEETALSSLESQSYALLHDPDIAAGEPGAERGDPSYRDVVQEARQRQALGRLNPLVPGVWARLNSRGDSIIPAKRDLVRKQWIPRNRRAAHPLRKARRARRGVRRALRC